MKSLIPVTIVTGFLGSGKTTLLTSLIKTRQTRRLAILINEFGEVSIDGVLVRDTAGDDEQIRIDDFPYGLIAYDEDELFIPTLLAIAERRANIDHLLIETSGLALPTAIMEVLQSSELADDFILDATLAVVDTPLLLEQQFETNAGSQAAVSTLFEQQLEFADVVVLNKIDKLDDNALLKAERLVREKAPNVRFLELAYNAQLDIQLALGLRLHQPSEPTSYHPINPALSPIPNAESKVPANQRPFDGHAHSGLAAHSHGLTTHKHFHEQDPGWLSFVLRTTDIQQSELLKTALVEAARQEPVLRCKGFINTQQGMLLAQGVRTRLELSHEDSQTTSHNSELVFIGYHLSRGKVTELLSRMTQTDWK
jgi:cobalamin biosynthesis protein CobW